MHLSLILDTPRLHRYSIEKKRKNWWCLRFVITSTSSKKMRRYKTTGAPVYACHLDEVSEYRTTTYRSESNMVTRPIRYTLHVSVALQKGFILLGPEVLLNNMACP
jgi:hypothetical protein